MKFERRDEKLSEPAEKTKGCRSSSPGFYSILPIIGERVPRLKLDFETSPSRYSTPSYRFFEDRCSRRWSIGWIRWKSAVGNERGPVNQPWNPRIREARSMRSRIKGKWIGGGRAAPPRGQCPLLSTDEITIIDWSPFNGSTPDLRADRATRSIHFF